MASHELCPDIDMDKGIAQFGGNEELFMSILGYYVADMRTLLESAKTVSEDGLEAYAQTAHAIKGSSRNVFVNGIGDEAEKLEHAAKEGDFAYVLSHHEEFFAQALKLVQDIEDMIASRSS